MKLETVMKIDGGSKKLDTVKVIVNVIPQELVTLMDNVLIQVMLISQNANGSIVTTYVKDQMEN